MKKVITVILALSLIIPFGIFNISAVETNIAFGKSYTYTGTYVSGGKIVYPDTDEKELTDGVTGEKEDIGFESPIWVGMNINGVNAINYTNSIVVDLEKVENKLTKFVLTTEACDGGITPPYVEVLVSDDNMNYDEVGSASSRMIEPLNDFNVSSSSYTSYNSYSSSTSYQPLYTSSSSSSYAESSYEEYSTTTSYNSSYTESDNSYYNDYDESDYYGIYTCTVSLSGAISARYVKFVLNHQTNWAFVSEVEVYQNPNAADALPNNVFVTTFNRSITAGASAIFTNSFSGAVDGEISSTAANLKWASFLIAKPGTVEGQYIVTSVQQFLWEGSVYIPTGGFLLAAHFDDRDPGSEAYERTRENFYSLLKFKPGNIITLNGIDLAANTVSDNASVVLFAKGNTIDPVYDSAFTLDLYSSYFYTPGKTIDLTVSIRDIVPEKGIRSLRFVLYYDQSKVEPAIAGDSNDQIAAKDFLVLSPNSTKWDGQAAHNSDFYFYDVEISTTANDALAKENGSIVISIPFKVKAGTIGDILFRSPSSVTYALDYNAKQVDGKASSCYSHESNSTNYGDEVNTPVTAQYNQTAPTLDGVVVANEYGQMIHSTYDSDQFVSQYDTDKSVDSDFYMTWNKDSLYLSWVVNTDNHYPVSKTADYDNDGTAGTPTDFAYMWQFSCVQFMLSTGAPDASQQIYQTGAWSGNYLEAGLSILSDGTSYKAIWSKPIGAESITTDDFDFSGKRNETTNTTTYEVRIPWNKLGLENVNNNTQFGLTYSVSDQENFDIKPSMCEWQDAMLGNKNMDAGAVITLAGFNSSGSAYISGNSKNGETLTANLSNVVTTGKTVKYQWYCNGIAITNATNKTYVIANTDVGKEIMVVVTVTDGTDKIYESNAVIPTQKAADDNYSIRFVGAYANGITDKQKFSDLERKLSSGFTVRDAKNNLLSGNSAIGTGCVINYNGNNYTVIVKGDISGDGIVDARDYLMVKRACLGTYSLSNIQLKAACMEDTSLPTAKDYLKIKRHFLGTFDLYEAVTT